MQKEEVMLQKRLQELSGIAYQRNIITYSDFLNLNELHILHTMPKNTLDSVYKVFGGYDYSERQMAAFLPDAFYLRTDEKIPYPMEMIRIRPLQRKFADPLCHRDYLGALLNLGLDRCKIGDILIEESSAVCFVQKQIAAYICQELTRVRHTAIIADLIEEDAFTCRPNFEQVKGSVASVRLDSLLALTYNASRSKLVAYIENGKVFVNGRMVTSNGYQVKENDIISVRGVGRFVFREILSQTKKGRYYVLTEKYI